MIPCVSSENLPARRSSPPSKSKHPAASARAALLLQLRDRWAPAPLPLNNSTAALSVASAAAAKDSGSEESCSRLLRRIRRLRSQQRAVVCSYLVQCGTRRYSHSLVLLPFTCCFPSCVIAIMSNQRELLLNVLSQEQNQSAPHARACSVQQRQGSADTPSECTQPEKTDPLRCIHTCAEHASLTRRSYAVAHNRHAKLHVLCEPNCPGFMHLQAYRAAAAADAAFAAPLEFDQVQMALHLAWQSALIAHAAMIPSTMSYPAAGPPLPAAATTGLSQTAASLSDPPGFSHMAAFPSALAALLSTAAVSSHPAAPPLSSAESDAPVLPPSAAAFPPAPAIIPPGSDANNICAAATQSGAADAFPSTFPVVASATPVFHMPSSSEHDMQGQPFAALLSAALPATDNFQRNAAAAAAIVSPSLTPSGQAWNGAAVDWLGPPQCGLNAYTGELLLETVRHRLGGESREFEQASLLLRQFFDLLDSTATAPPLPGGPVRVASSRRLIPRAPTILAAAGASPSDSAVAATSAPPSKAAALPSHASSTAAALPAEFSDAAAASHIVTRKELIRHALKNLGGAHFDGAEHHGFIAYRHDTSSTVSIAAWPWQCGDAASFVCSIC